MPTDDAAAAVERLTAFLQSGTYSAGDDDADDYEQELAAAIRTVLGLLAKLPKTEDGVPVVPGMYLYYPPKNYSHCVVDAVRVGCVDMHSVDWDGEILNVWRMYKGSFGYSTRAAGNALQRKEAHEKTRYNERKHMNANEAIERLRRASVYSISQNTAVLVIADDLRTVLEVLAKLRATIEDIASDKTLRTRQAGYHARRVALTCGALLAELDGTYTRAAAEAARKDGG